MVCEVYSPFHRKIMVLKHPPTPLQFRHHKLYPIHKLAHLTVNLYSFYLSNKHLTCILLVANSTPIVDLDSRLNSLRVKRDNKLLFPTPESPMSTTANIQIQVIPQLQQ
jgi:hypothetical protein